MDKKQLIVVLAISLLCYFCINFKQDEFLHFHNLAYLNPNFTLVNFTEGFNSYTKTNFNHQFNLPFPYTGTLQGILFFPFFKLFPLLIGKGIYSFLSLILFFYLLKKELNLLDAYFQKIKNTFIVSMKMEMKAKSLLLAIIPMADFYNI